ncbi:hypothetical protein ONZ45_g18736 [Pleurotus djamor]|nr:hypothetical protein ONZ45_g18736 [Pleurotus djamor]
MIPWLLLLPLPTLASSENIFGLDPALSAKYVPSGNTWTCLDGSKQIPWSAVNDDYCDCKDGSDEPGTGACPNSTFHCRNVGHISANIPSWQVHDGLCETACCDGSDELPGVCPDRCKEIGEEYRKKRDEENKLRKTGSKIRSTYIAFAHKEKKRLEDLIQNNLQEIAAREKEVERLRDIAERTESISAAALEHKKESPLYLSLVKHSNALKSLQREHKKHLEREKALGDILDSLRTGYNPNYQDMAVLEAVRGWEFHAGLPHINDVGKEDEAEHDGEVKDAPEAPVAETLEEGMWSAEELERDLDALINTDYVSLLLEHDEHVQNPEPDSVLFDLASYIPESLYPSYEELKETITSWMEKLGVIKTASDPAADSARARQALTDAENKLNDIKRVSERAEDDIKDIFDVEGFGAEGEWKKLDGTCIEKDTGEYTYEVCLFGEAKQKPNRGGSTFSLGKFESWNPDPDVKVGSPEFYSKQVYKHGTRCWNGPERSVFVVLTCGLENAIHSVVELEKFAGQDDSLFSPPSSESSPLMVAKQLEELGDVSTDAIFLGVYVPPAPSWQSQKKASKQKAPTLTAPGSLVDALTIAFSKNDVQIESSPCRSSKSSRLIPNSPSSPIQVTSPHSTTPAACQASSSIQDFSSTLGPSGPTLSLIEEYPTEESAPNADEEIIEEIPSENHDNAHSSSSLPLPPPPQQQDQQQQESQPQQDTYRLRTHKKVGSARKDVADVAEIGYYGVSSTLDTISMPINLRHVFGGIAHTVQRPTRFAGHATQRQDPEAELEALLNDVFGSGVEMGDRGSLRKPEGKGEGKRPAGKRRRTVAFDEASLTGDQANTETSFGEGEASDRALEKHSRKRKRVAEERGDASTRVQETIPTEDPGDEIIETVEDVARRVQKLIKGKSRMSQEVRGPRLNVDH